MCLAWIASLRSEDPFFKVGCAALNKNNRVIATGYNGLLPGQTLSAEQWLDRDGRLEHVIHAEINAMGLCERGEIHTLAVTLLPCGSCATKAIDHGVKRILYGQLYKRDSSAIEIFKEAGIETQRIPIRSVFCAIQRGLAEAFDPESPYEVG